MKNIPFTKETSCFEVKTDKGNQWVTENEEMTIPTQIIGDIVNITDNLYEFSEMTPKEIELILYNQKEGLLVPLKEEVLKKNVQISLRNDRITELTAEQQKLENEETVVPFFRRPETIESRKKLRESKRAFCAVLRSGRFY